MAYPVRYAVQAFCAYKGYEVTTRSNTWVIERGSAAGAGSPLTRLFGERAGRETDTDLARAFVALQHDVRDLRAEVLRAIETGADAGRKRPRWQRRLAKLRKDPARFVRDSWPVRALSGRRG
jgi:hypothetical protein